MWRKKRFIIPVSLLLIVFIILFFLSTLLKNWLIKNSEKIIGRKIDLRELHLNYFRCSVMLNGFVMYEKDKVNSFVRFDELYVNFDPWNLIKHEYVFSEIRLINPNVIIDYNGENFNFSDLLNSDKSQKNDTGKKKEKGNFKYVLKNLNIKQGYFKYNDLAAKTSQDMRNFDLTVPYISWNSKQSNVGVNFALGKKGEVFVNGIIYQISGKYAIYIKTKNIEIAPFTNYFKSYMDISFLQGGLDGDIKISGDMSKITNFMINGGAEIKNCLIKDMNKKQFFTADLVSAVFDSLDFGRSDYRISKIYIQNPQLAADLNKDKLNLEKIFAPYFASDTVNPADTTKLKYSIDSLFINNGKIMFTDLTLNRPFYLDINKLEFKMFNFSDNSTNVPLVFSMNLGKTGTFKGNYKLNMVNYKDIDFDGSIAKLEMIWFSPYSEYYLARPITKGVFNYQCKLKMTTDKLDNSNEIKIVNPKFGKKTKDTAKYKVPVNLALYILKDSKGLIDINLPVEGKPSDPDFKYRKLIWKTLEAFLLKTIAMPFVAIGKSFHSDPDNIKYIPFALLQDSLNNDQKQRLDKISQIIKDKPELIFTFSQTTDNSKEMELLALNDAKYRYFLKNLPPDTDPVTIKRKAFELQNQDHDFVAFINSNIKADSTLSIEKKCLNFTGIEKTDNLLNLLLKTREKLINNYLSSKGLNSKSFIVKTEDLRNLPVELQKPQFNVELSAE